MPRRSIATRPSTPLTSTPKFVPWVTTTSAQAGRKRSSAQSIAARLLDSTTNLEIRAFTVIDFESYLHRLTANLAILDVRLLAGTEIQHEA